MTGLDFVVVCGIIMSKGCSNQIRKQIVKFEESGDTHTSRQTAINVRTSVRLPTKNRQLNPSSRQVLILNIQPGGAKPLTL